MTEVVEATVPGRIGIVPWQIAGFLLAAVPAHAQSNIDAGKTPAQVFSNTCNACHRSARELRPTSASFLAQHYSTGGREAAAMAAYLASIGSDPRAVQQRRPAVLGAGQAALPDGRPAPASAGDLGKPSPPVVKPRRPSDSVEAGEFPLAAGPVGDPDATPAQAATPLPRTPVPDFEE